jgi:hypothetical protein
MLPFKVTPTSDLKLANMGVAYDTATISGKNSDATVTRELTIPYLVKRKLVNQGDGLHYYVPKPVKRTHDDD